MRHVLFGAALIATVGTMAAAQGVNLKGKADCADWVTSRASGDTNYESFLLGLLNGWSLGSLTEFWVGPRGELSAEQVYLWMDNYCQANPLSIVVTGAGTLFNEVTKP